MAEVAVAAALGVVQIFIPLLDKLNLPGDVENDIQSMRSWLSSIKAFMEDNSGRQRNNIILDQLHKVRKIAYDIEDVLDDFILHSPPYTFHRHKINRRIHNYAHQIHHGFPLRGVKDKIASIRQEIKQFKQQAAAFGDRDSSLGGTSAVRVSPLLLDEHMVGYEMQKEELKRKVEDGDKRLLRLAVDGPGGSGKTTLVKNVFWKPIIQEQFDCHAWVCVSQNSDTEKMLQNLLLQLCSSRNEPYPADDGLTMQTRLQRYLAGKRYIVVLDDIWRHEDWSKFKNSLPDSNRGSRIIITTHNSNVSSSFASSSHDHICSLKALESLDGWKLFCRKTFPDTNGECPLEVEDTAMSIVARCEGLPLAIVAVAGALAQKPLHEWEKFHKNFGREIGSGSNLSAISDALLRSSMDLSSSLKCCFLYMSIFPEDYSVERGRLIRLWVAEGFAVATEDHTAEEVAEDYLNELIQRNLIHVSNWDFDGRPRNCRLLNVLKFIINNCKDENFAAVFSRENSSQTQPVHNQSQMIRRLSVHDHFEHWPGNDDLARVRSLLLLRLSAISPSDFERSLRKLKLVKVVDVHGEGLTEFPKEITRFTLVRYLSFRNTKIKVIPSSIQKLSYLETLDLEQTDVTELPQEISHLQNLCHLLVYKYNVINNDVAFDTTQGVKLHEGISKLTHLQTLSLVKVGRKGKILQDFRLLTQLRKLGLTGLKQEHGKDLCAAVELMRSLRTLDVSSATKEECIDVEEMKNPPESLQRLYLEGRLKKLPSWIPKLHGLVRIGLKWSKLSDSPLESLERLPNLTELLLVDCYSGEELTFGGCGFKKVKILEVEEMGNVRMMVIEDGAMCEVKKISLRRCGGMRMVLGVKNLKKVEELSLYDMAEELSLYDMAEELVARLRRNGEDREWVKHVPLIRSYALTNQSLLLENLSDPVSFSH